MHTNGVSFDSYTLCSSLTSSSRTKDVTSGRQIHAVGGKSGWLSSVFVGSALIDLYSKFSNVKDAGPCACSMKFLRRILYVLMHFLLVMVRLDYGSKNLK
ncbi:hypothetical protein QN277_022977 [Acacia crassicarpa]|uniref:Uncharacterized protein n=1 Tax=Acacia crassicarpa TaxID=499986 RepID=A0AAE1JKT6_9FABA|nr:hypothetical protein QN277_022977 [Acacia crassicarpa]